MKTTNYILAIVFLLSVNVMFAQKVEVNSKKSNIDWLGKKVLGQHNGNIQLKSGYFELADDKITEGEFVIDMTTISCADLEDEDYNRKLVGHLKSDDFFGVKNYPTANFVVTESSQFIDGKATLTGDITIKGITKPISFEVEIMGDEYITTLKIDRSKFNVRYGSDSFFDNLGDKAIDDIFTLDIKLAVE